jgi:hypothetical protein
VRNGLVILGASRDARINDAYLCLYGSSPPVTRLNPTAGTAWIPWWITVAEMLHTLGSAILIFLIALAVRNQFKIK